MTLADYFVLGSFAAAALPKSWTVAGEELTIQLITSVGQELHIQATFGGASCETTLAPPPVGLAGWKALLVFHPQLGFRWFVLSADTEDVDGAAVVGLLGVGHAYSGE